MKGMENMFMKIVIIISENYKMDYVMEKEQNILRMVALDIMAILKMIK